MSTSTTSTLDIVTRHEGAMPLYRYERVLEDSPVQNDTPAKRIERLVENEIITPFDLCGFVPGRDDSGALMSSVELAYKHHFSRVYTESRGEFVDDIKMYINRGEIITPFNSTLTEGECLVEYECETFVGDEIFSSSAFLRVKVPSANNTYQAKIGKIEGRDTLIIPIRYKVSETINGPSILKLSRAQAIAET